MPRILVVANETIGGRALVDLVRERAAAGDAHFFLVVPRMTPRHGSIIYDEAIFQAAQVRVDLARAYLRREMSIEAVGEVGDPDPYSAAMDAIGEWHPDEVVVSTKPATSSGWLRRDLIERIADASGLPVKHVVSDVEREGTVFKVTLVVANRTAATDHLLESLRELHGPEGNRLFIVVVPQEGGTGVHGQRATGRLNQLLDRLHAAGLLAAGMIGDPDPYTATQNARQFFAIDEIVISTLGAERSGWLRADLVERVRRSSGGIPVEHIVSEVATAGAR